MDHPRLRGEHSSSIKLTSISSGSPPPTRGTHPLTNRFIPDFGITPAYAGNTAGELAALFSFWDHPRLRGEHGKSDTWYPRMRGSPPPTRGTLSHCSSRSVPARITPAYAGNTSEQWKSVANLGDHPRLRGEHPGVQVSRWFGWGSPPPTRGTQIVAVIIEFCVRITPAYAGNTVNRTHDNLVCGDHPRLRGEHSNS